MGGQFGSGFRSELKPRPGIGLGVVEALVAQGASVFVVGVSAEHLAELSQKHPQVVTIQADIRDIEVGLALLGS